MDYQKILEDIYQEILPYAEKGKQADYIPALAKVNPDQFGICLQTVTGESYSYMQADQRFSIQSIAKVFALAMGLSLKGEALWKNVGKEPSGTAGVPMLEAILASGITDVCVCVVRYFGGIKLGAGGLIRAYSGSVSACLAEAAKTVKAFLSVELSMGQLIEDVELATRCLKPVLLCNRAGGMIPSPEEVLAKIEEINEGGDE